MERLPAGMPKACICSVPRLPVLDQHSNHNSRVNIERAFTPVRMVMRPRIKDIAKGCSIWKTLHPGHVLASYKMEVQKPGHFLLNLSC